MKTRPNNGYTYKGGDYSYWKSRTGEYNRANRILKAPNRYRVCGVCDELYCFLLRKNSIRTRVCNFCLSDEPLFISQERLITLREKLIPKNKYNKDE